jgi:hypothetical protein
LTKKSPKFGTVLILAVLALHLLLACGFMLYFFHVPSSSQAIKVDPVKTIQGLCKMDRATNVLAQTLFPI